MEKKRNTLLIVIIIMFVLLFIPWGDIHTAVFDTAKSQEDVIRIAERELKAHEDEEFEIIDSFLYAGNNKAAVWVQYDNKVALMYFDRNWGHGYVFNKIAKPISRGDGCYSEPVFPDGYAFLSTNEKIATFFINGKEIQVEKVPFIYFYQYKIPESEVERYTITTEYYFLDKEGNEL